MIAFLRRNINDCPEHVKADCYKTLVRPILEYGSAVWDPHHQVDIDNLEQIQKRAARFTTGNYTQETGNTKINMQKLKWKPLEERRAIIKLNLFYKCKMKLIDIHTDHLVLSKSCTRRGERTYAGRLIVNVYFTNKCPIMLKESDTMIWLRPNYQNAKNIARRW